MANNGLFRIALHVHVCVTGDGSVLLDLKRDKYLGLGREETEILAAVIDAWPKPSWDGAGPVQGAQERAEALCRTLAADGVLTLNNPCCPRVSAAPAFLESVFDMKREWVSIGDEIEVEGRVTVRHVVNFAAAFLWARCNLAWRPFFSTVEAIRARKSRRGNQANDLGVLQAAALVDVFRRLRPFVFSAEGRCLLHALTLVKFLSSYDFYPEWVIGVATRPWAAHSWVQSGNCLLDSNPEKVCRFTSIMVV